MKNNPQKHVRVLSIDGGGVRGIIPARILQEVETKTGKPVHELFDLIVGNSTGSILSLGLTVPRKPGVAKLTAEDLVKFYQQNVKKIFSHSLGSKLTAGWGLWGPKYSRYNLDKLLQQVLGDTKLSQTLTPVMCTSYSLDQSLPHLWSSYRARQEIHHDHYLRDVAGASSAAPTYFAPKVINTPDGEKFHEVDGGLWANNPELIAALGVKEMAASNTNVLLVSLGTGQAKLNKPVNTLKNAGIIGWLVKANLIDIMMNAESEWSESLTKILYPHNYRLQVPITPALSEMDNSTQQNMEGLLVASEAYLQQQRNVVETICQALV